MSSAVKFVALMLTMAALATPAAAGQIKWAGTSSAHWTDPNDWVGSVVPTFADTVVFDASSTHGCFVTGFDSCASLIISGWAQTLTIGAGDTLAVLGDLSQTGPSSTVDFADPSTAVLEIAGNLTRTSGAFNATAGTVLFFTPGLKTVTGVNAFGNFVINFNWYVSFSENISIQGTLTFNAGGIMMNGDTLTIANLNDAGFYDYVDGTVRRTFADSGTLVFPTGSTSGGTGPGFATIHVRSGSFPATVAATSYGSPYPEVTDENHTLGRSWQMKVLSGTVGLADVTLQYNSSDADKTDEESYIVGMYDGSGWTFEPSTMADTSNTYYHTISATGATALTGAWVVGLQNALPIVLDFFTASEQANRGVVIDWSTISETNTLGFVVQRKEGSAGTWTAVSRMIPGAGTSLQKHDYSFTDATVSNATYFYRIKEVDLNGAVNYSGEIKIVVSGVLDAHRTAPLPTKYGLDQNYPNPFNPKTDFRYRIVNFGLVTLKVYDVLGREVATVVNEMRQPGEYTASWDAANVPSGVYIYRLTAGTFRDSKKLVVLK